MQETRTRKHSRKGPLPCGTANCDKAATCMVHWPGRSLPMCAPCALRAGNVATHMGFNLTTEPFTERLRELH